MKKSIHDESIREIHDLGEHILLFQGFFSNEFCQDCIDTFHLCEEKGLAFSRQDHVSGPSTLSIEDKAVPILNIPSSSLPRTTELQDIFHNEIIPEFFNKYPIPVSYTHLTLPTKA